jgi:hypothetical protein
MPNHASPPTTPNSAGFMYGVWGEFGTGTAFCGCRTCRRSGAMEQRIVLGAVVEHAGQRWRVDRVLGADAVLLRGEDGSPVVADPARVTFPGQATESRTSLPPATLRAPAPGRCACDRRVGC